MADPAGREITQRELRNDSGAIMRGVERGESYTITRNGTPIGRLIPLRRRTFVPREQVIATFTTAAVVDPDRLRADLDAATEQDPFGRGW
jgi:prevent-host-death family protein